MKKNILFIYGPLGAGGAEKVLLDILNNFDYQRYNVDLCLMMPGGQLYSNIPSKVHTFSLWKGYTLSYRMAYHLSTNLGIHYFLRKKMMSNIPDKYDAVISFLEGMPLKLHALTHLKGKQITWIHCDLYRFPYEKTQFFHGEELYAYNKMHSIVCVSNDTEKAFHLRFPTCQISTVVIYNPIDIDNVIKLGNIPIKIPNNKFTIVTVGRLTQPKKMDRIVRIAQMMKKKEYDSFEFQIIGQGELQCDLERQIKEADVADCVKLLGYKNNPYSYIKNADMMFCCSGYEGFCLAICEAMALGTPVVSTKTSGPIEILDNDKYGLLCEHDDESMYTAVITMMKDSHMRSEYSELGKERVKKFSVEHTMNNIYKLLDNG